MTGPVDQGQTYRYRHIVKDSAGVLANAGTVTATVTLPDGTTTNPTVSNTSTGVYDIAYTTSQVGLHNVFGSATGGVLGSEFDKWEDAFTVEQRLRQIIGVDEASNHLRAAGVITSDADREQLRWLCLVASDAVERDLAKVIARRTVVETYDGDRSAIRLRTQPVISITSVVEDGTTLVENTDFVFNQATGLLFRGSPTWTTTFTAGVNTVVVTYVAGYTLPPLVVRKAALNLVQEMWQTSQQASHPLINEELAGALVPAAFEGLTSIERSAYRSIKNIPGHA